MSMYHAVTPVCACVVCVAVSVTDGCRGPIHNSFSTSTTSAQFPFGTREYSAVGTIRYMDPGGVP